MNRPDWLISMPDEEYQAATKRNEYVTSHRLNVFRKCPLEFRKRELGEIVDGETAAFLIGRATHSLVLEGETEFRNGFIVADGPINEKTGKPYGKDTVKYREWFESQNMPVVSPSDFDIMKRMENAVRGHEFAADILSSGIAEGVVRGTWEGVSVQCRIDWYDPERNIIADLKTCNDVDKFQFDVRDFGYVTQMGFYAEMVRMNTDKLPKVFLIAVEKREPFRVAVAEVCPGSLDDANFAEPGTRHGTGNALLLRELVNCRKSDKWPTRYELPFII